MLLARAEVTAEKFVKVHFMDNISVFIGSFFAALLDWKIRVPEIVGAVNPSKGRGGVGDD